MPVRILLVPVLYVLISLPVALCQSSSPAAVEPSRPVIHTNTREVLLDLVVRDKHHHAVTNLRPEEVDVYEDGVRQNIRVFRNIQGSESPQPGRSAPASQHATAPDAKRDEA